MGWEEGIKSGGVGSDWECAGLGCGEAAVGGWVGGLGSSLICTYAMELRSISGGDVVVGIFGGGEKPLVEPLVVEPGGFSQGGVGDGDHG